MSGSSRGNLLYSGGGIATTPTSNRLLPDEGPRVIHAQYNWTNSASYFEDLNTVVADGGLTTIQSIYIDNSQGLFPVKVVVSGSLQVITCAAYSICIAPCFFSGMPSYTVSSMVNGGGFANTAFVSLFFCNFEITPQNVAAFNSIPYSNTMQGLTFVNLAPNTQWPILNVNSPIERFTYVGIQIYYQFIGAATVQTGVSVRLLDSFFYFEIQPITVSIGDTAWHLLNPGFNVAGYTSVNYPSGGNAVGLSYDILPPGCTGANFIVNQQFELFQ